MLHEMLCATFLGACDVALCVSIFTDIVKFTHDSNPTVILAVGVGIVEITTGTRPVL